MLVIFFISFIALYVAIGIAYALKIKTLNDFFIRSNSLGFTEATSSLIVTQLGASMILDTLRKGFEYGIYGLFYPLGVTLGLVLLTTKIAESWRSHNIKTTAEIFRTRYKSVSLQKLAALVSIISLMGILIAQVTALRLVICPYLSLAHYCLFFGTWICVILYTMLGGLDAVIRTGFVQGLLIYSFFGLFVITVLIVEPYSYADILATITANPMLPPEVTVNQIFSLFLLPGLFILISQDVLQFIIKAKTVAIAKAATSVSSILLITFAFLPFICGLIAKKVLPGVDESTHVIVALMQALVPQWILALGLCAISAAIISTADSMLIAICSYITNDLTPEYPHTISSTRLLIAALGIFSLVISYYWTVPMLWLLLHSYEFALSILFIPMMACIFFTDWSDGARRAWASCIIGGISYLVNLYLLPTSFPNILLTFGLAILPFLARNRPDNVTKDSHWKINKG